MAQKGYHGTKVTKMKQVLKYGLNCIKTSSGIILDRFLQENHTNENKIPSVIIIIKIIIIIIVLINYQLSTSGIILDRFLQENHTNENKIPSVIIIIKIIMIIIVLINYHKILSQNPLMHFF